MSSIKTKFVQAIRIFGIMALVAAFAASAFPARGYAAEATNPGKLTVQVYNGTNGSLQGLAGARVAIVDSNGVGVAKAMTNESGVAILELAAGEYRVSVSAPGFKSAENKVSVKEGQNIAARFVLYSTSRIPSGK